MIVLVIDTSCGRSNLAIYGPSGILGAVSTDSGIQQAETIPGMLSILCSEANVKLEHLGGIAVVTGPGSFTGLRVGLSFAKGLSLRYETPLLPLNSLDAMAWGQQDNNSKISPMLDAKKGQVYTALYQVDKDKIERVSEYLAADPQDWLSRLPAGTVVAGSGVMAHHELCLRYKNITISRNRTGGPEIDGLVRLSRNLEQIKEWVSPGHLDAFYIRPPDAELKKKHVTA